ncbi:MAG: LPS assembly protein LptD [Acidobacteriota bacterium]|nr:LPS assembly protein LptD [Acidobacteriota bacterium]
MSTINTVPCHGFFSLRTPLFTLLLLLQAQILLPQISRSLPAPSTVIPAPSVLQPEMSVKVPRPDAPPVGEWNIKAIRQTVEGSKYYLRGAVELEFPEMILKADEMDYDEDTGYAEARGNVYFRHFQKNEQISCDRVEYNVREETGKFYNVRGHAKTRIDARPGVLSSNNPFYFEGKWAERLNDKYILHDGFITGCKLPRPWWTLHGPVFDIIPEDRALAYRAIFRLRKVPLFYTPFFYKSLKKLPRQSGFLTPNIGNSSVRGKMMGLGYFWAINRSYDVTYRVQDFTERGFAHHVDFRGQPTDHSFFDAILFAVQDRGQLLKDGTRVKQGGYSIYMTAGDKLSHGWEARGTLDYLSSLIFRQAFTESFNEAIFSESHSSGFLTNHFSSYTINISVTRLQNFQTAMPGDSIVIQKLPEFEFASRDRQISNRILPVWVSFESSVALLHRSQPMFQTGQFTDRVNFAPSIMTALHWKGFNLIPSFTLHETQYSESVNGGTINSTISGEGYHRNVREIAVDLVPPSLERVFNRKTWLGEKLKHVIEPRASFRSVSGVADFTRAIRFDETELLSNTTEGEISITNRIYAKKGGVVSEILNWEIWQRRYFDPNFGDAVMPGMRNVVLSTADLTPYAFLDRSRNYSPIVSVLRLIPRPGFGIEWRADYDPLLGHIVNSGFTADARLSKYFISVGHNQVRSNPLVLSPSGNQMRGGVGYGNANQRGWNAGFTAIYDYRTSVVQFATTQVTYNTDCCGISVQYRRFGFAINGIARNDNQFRVSFAIANVGAFGTLKKQERLF